MQASGGHLPDVFGVETRQSVILGSKGTATVPPYWVTYPATVTAARPTRRARYARRRKRRMDRLEHDLSDVQWSALIDAWGGCAYCGGADRALQRDCVLAISRGGRYTLDNVVPACGSCNAGKCNEEVTTWLRRKRLDESRFLLRHLEIRTRLRKRFSEEGEV